MRSVLVVCLSLVLGAGSVAGAQGEKPESLEDRASYGIGLNLGRNMLVQGVAINVDFIAQGLRDAAEGGTALLTDEEIQTALQELQKRVQEEQQAKFAASADSNKKDGEAFLAANTAKEGVVTRPSGLQYKIVNDGDGPMPSESDTVRVHYEGRLIDGTVFDSSIKRGTPAEFPINGVIQGWIEALPLMKVGSKWQLFIPSEMAYKDRGQGQIGPNSVLIFDVELLEIVTPEAE